MFLSYVLGFDILMDGSDWVLMKTIWYLHTSTVTHILTQFGLISKYQKLEKLVLVVYYIKWGKTFFMGSWNLNQDVSYWYNDWNGVPKVEAKKSDYEIY